MKDLLKKGRETKGYSTRKLGELAEIDQALISKFENGFHPGQNDDPKKIANKLEENGVSRYLFSVDDKGQFDIHFSVYVHSDEVELAQEVFGG